MNMPPAPDLDAASDSSDLSSVHSPQNAAASDTIRVNRYSLSGSSASNEGVAHASAHAALHDFNSSLLSTAPNPAPLKGKRPRKARELKSEPKDDKSREKEKKPRKPREVKAKNEDASAAAPRKRQKTADKSAPSLPDLLSAAPRQATLSEMHFQTPGAPASAPHQPSLPSSHPQLSRPSSNIPDTTLRDTLQPPASKTPTPRPISSGQNYDPIRGSTMNTYHQTPSTHSSAITNGACSAQASPRVHRASASPSIHSLIDNPAPAQTNATPLSRSPQQSILQPQPSAYIRSAPPLSTLPRAAQPPLKSESTPTTTTQPSTRPISPPRSTLAMDIDHPKSDAMKQDQASKQSKPSSSAPNPAAQPKEKKAASPKAAGTGLLATSNLFGGPGAKQDLESRGVNIDIHIVLDRNGGNTINMAQEIAKKYGRDAINPRAAAHRERLLQVQAAANRLEGGSADDMSVDLMSEADGDSNMEMGGMDDEGKSTAADGEKPRKRRKKVEEYDKEDDFIDDTELAWQEQAAVAKDGFFVYSGPLVPEGQDAKIESSAPNGRGRGGRGRGRGRTTAAATAAAAAAAADRTTAVEKAKDPNAPTRGRGSRGGRTGAPRKPRITKADREKMEAEKAERERMVSGGHPPGGTPLQLNLTNTATPASLVSTSSLMGQQQAAQTVYSNGPHSNHRVPA